MSSIRISFSNHILCVCKAPANGLQNIVFSRLKCRQKETQIRSYTLFHVKIIQVTLYGICQKQGTGGLCIGAPFNDLETTFSCKMLIGKKSNPMIIPHCTQNTKNAFTAFK